MLCTEAVTSCPSTWYRSASLVRTPTSACGFSSSSKVVLSTVALTCGSFIRRNDPLPHSVGTKNVVALECAKVRKLTLDRELARASAQSISLTSVSRERFCRHTWRQHVTCMSDTTASEQATVVVKYETRTKRERAKEFVLDLVPAKGRGRALPLLSTNRVRFCQP